MKIPETRGTDMERGKDRDAGERERVTKAEITKLREREKEKTVRDHSIGQRKLSHVGQ